MTVEERCELLGFHVRRDSDRRPGAPEWTAYIMGVRRADGRTEQDAIVNLRMALLTDSMPRRGG